MAFPWKKIANVGMSVLGAVIPGVSVIEQIAGQFGNLKGKEKQDAVALLVRNALVASESIVGRDLADDDEVDKAARGVIDAVVAFNNIVAKRAAAKGLLA